MAIKRRILITGGGGMLGRDLVRRWHELHDVVAVDLVDGDLTELLPTSRLIMRYAPGVIVHCAAMTAVDACEQQRELAFRVNSEGAANVAFAARKANARLIAISTDYVFSGVADRPWRIDDPTEPRTVYGKSKLFGEKAIRKIMPDNSVIARTAWLYGPGGPSFVHTMRKLAAEKKPELRVVDDQFGNPTSTAALADALLEIIERPQLEGIFHLSCEGVASWCEFAGEIFRLTGGGPAVVPCTTAEFPRPAPRPAFSALDKSELARHGMPPMPPWQEALAAFLAEEP